MTAAPSPDQTGGQPGAGLAAADLTPGRPIVFRNATVLTMDDAHHVLHGADVLITGDRIAAVGPGLQVPEGTAEIDATGGIVMPGMIDTHRHMWQTAMRGYGADWTLTQYFVWYYLQWGKSFRPQDVYAGNLLSAIEAIDAGVTTTVDWSHGLQTTDHADAAVDALEEVPGRFVLAYGNIQQGPWEWSATPEFRDFVNRRFGSGNDMLGFQMAFDVPGNPEFPERAAFEVARDLGVPVTTHAGVWGATSDDGIRLMHEHGFMTPSTIYVHAATPVGRLLPPDRGDRRLGVGLHRERAERRAGLPAHLEAARARHPRLAVDGHQRLVERRPVLRHAGHAERGPRPRAPGGPRPGRDRDPPPPARRAGGRLGHPGRGEGAGPGLADREPGAGQEGRRRADQERRLAGDVPAAQPVRPRRLPGPARRRAHGGRERPGGQVRPPPGRHRPRPRHGR